MGAAIVVLLWAVEAAAPAPYERPPPLLVAPAGQPLTSIRANFLASVFDYVGVGIDVSHSFNRHLALEASANFASFPQLDGGFYGEAFARAGYFGSRNSLSFGLGPGFLYTSDFGRVVFVVPEIAYELRKRGSASFLAGVGVPVALNQSRDNVCPSPEFLGCLFDRLQYQSGDISLRLRLAIGYTF